MRVLSLTQPWASLICLGAKKIETRSWESWYQGPLLIHASKAYPRWAKEAAQEEPFYSALRPHGQYAYPEIACGHIIGMCQLIRCEPTEQIAEFISDQERAFGDYTEGRWAWILEEGKFLPKPIAARGALGLWQFDLNATENLHTASG